MSREHVGHTEVHSFAQDRVNLPKDKADEHRAQARRLREKVEGYLADHPDFVLVKSLLSGSLAKGLALRSLNDIDFAVYVKGAEAPKDINALLNFLADKLRKAFPNMSPDQVKPQTYSVTVSFKGSGLDVDVVPVLYVGKPDWRGDLVSQDDGSFLETSIPLHLEFTRKRKDKKKHDFAQVVRLLKYWARRLKAENESFRFKSFMIELICAHLADNGQDFSDYPEALQAFFTYIIKTDLRERIVFTDHYSASKVPKSTDRGQIIDPINCENNVARLYTDEQASVIVEAPGDAGDELTAIVATAAVPIGAGAAEVPVAGSALTRPTASRYSLRI